MRELTAVSQLHGHVWNNTCVLVKSRLVHSLPITLQNLDIIVRGTVLTAFSIQYSTRGKDSGSATLLYIRISSSEPPFARHLLSQRVLPVYLTSCPNGGLFTNHVARAAMCRVCPNPVTLLPMLVSHLGQSDA